MNLAGVEAINLADVPSKEIYPGITKRELWRGAGGAKALVLEFAPGATFTELDEHFPGSEEIFVVSGIFSDGAQEYGPGTFIHCPMGSSHIPQSQTGCSIFVFFPDG